MSDYDSDTQSVQSDDIFFNKEITNRVYFEPPDEPFYELTHPFLDFDFLVKSCITFGERIPKPFESIDTNPSFSAKFRKHLHQIEHNRPTGLQSYCWPCIVKGRSIACIAGLRSGKTCAYLACLINTWQKGMELQNSDIENFEGEKAIIVCSSNKKAKNVFDEAIKILGQEEYPRIGIISPDIEQNNYSLLLNGIEILISTPSPLIKLIEEGYVIMTQTNTLIFDDAHHSFVLSRNDIQLITAEYFRSYKSRDKKSKDVSMALSRQILVFAEVFNKEVRSYCEINLTDPVYIFVDYFEAALFIKPNINLKFCQQDNFRVNYITSLVSEILLRKDIDNKRIAVCCHNVSECISLHNEFNKQKIKHIMLHELIYNYEYSTIVYQSMNLPKNVLIISDQVVRIFPQIDYIDIIVHFNVERGQETLSIRSALLRHQIKNKNNFEIYIILSPSNHEQSPYLHNLMLRLHLPIPDQLVDLRKHCKLCESYLAFGHCLLNSMCLNRHEFINTEKPLTTLPTNGMLKINVTYVATANKIYFRIIKYCLSSSEKKSWNDYYFDILDITPELNKLKNAPLNTVKEPLLGQMYAVVIRGIVQRVKVSQIFGLSKREHYEEISEDKTTYDLELFHIDYGHTTRSTSYYLINLSPKLRTIPNLAHKAYLVGIKPVNNETEWNYKATSFLYEKMIKNNLCLTAWIRLQIKGIFWLDNVKIISRLKSVKLNVFSESIASKLINNGLAIKNDCQLPGFNNDYEESTLRWQIANQERIIQKSFLRSNVSNLAYLTSFVGINEFYVQLSNYNSCLQDLEKIMAKDDLKRIKYLSPGLMCICKHLDGSLNRAMILTCQDEMFVEVMFVDYGDTNQVKKTDCYILAEKYITRLPFQAIKCKLLGVEGKIEIDPKNIYDFTRDIENCYQNVIVKWYGEKGDVGEYSVHCYVQTDPKNSSTFKSLGWWLVENGYCEFRGNKGESELQMKEPENEDEITYKEEIMRDNFLNEINNRINSTIMKYASNVNENIKTFDPKKLTKIQKITNKQKYSNGESNDEKNDKDSKKLFKINAYIPDKQDILPYDPSDDSCGSDLEGPEHLDLEGW